MCDKDIADAQELARRKAAKVTQIEKQRTPLEHEVHVKPGIMEGIVDQHRIEVTRHSAARLKLYGRSVQFPFYLVPEAPPWARRCARRPEEKEDHLMSQLASPVEIYWKSNHLGSRAPDIQVESRGFR
jgi:hypothetical protein